MDTYSFAFLKTGDAYANDLYNRFNKTAMNAFPSLSDKDIDAILAYISSVPAPGAAAPGVHRLAALPLLLLKVEIIHYSSEYLH
jgi:mono/diheme cytochrome c family protein